MGLVKWNLYVAPKETKIMVYQSIVTPTLMSTQRPFGIPTHRKIKLSLKKHNAPQPDLSAVTIADTAVLHQY